MFEYSNSIYLSHTSEDEHYFDQNTSNTRKHHHHQALASSHKRPRGRPPGSKNRPKPPLVITQGNEEALKPVFIEVATGLDVVKALVNFARHHHVGISVLSGSGSIANVTLRHPLPHTSPFTIHGPFTMLAFTGTYICGSPPSVAPSSSFAFNPFDTYTNSFRISLLGSQGEIFGGVIDGKIVSGSTVTVMATVFKKPEFHKVGFNGNDEGGVGEKDHNPSSSGSGNNIMSDLLNPQVPSVEDDVMQWSRIYSSTFSGNNN